ncbi:MAG: hypothetical protein J5746_13785 [Victivallales bacterium]|nr:hypothetical protein [Victivallales bacterium]
MRTFWLLMLSMICTTCFADITEAKKDFDKGNYKFALEKYKKILSSQTTSPQDAAECFEKACDCLVKLRQLDSEIDELAARAIEAQHGHWRIAMQIAKNFDRISHCGWLAEGRFQRGGRHNGGKWINVDERDRAFCLRLLANADGKPDTADAKCEYYNLMLICLMQNRHGQAWKLQLLTDLNKEPDWECGNYDDWNCSGAPVDENGQPVFYKMPRSWEEATNDGERFRWLLNALAKNGQENEATMQYADFLCSQFDVSNLFGLHRDRDMAKWLAELDELTEDETFSQLATGIKRITLPDEHSYVKLYKSIKPGSKLYGDAQFQLGEIYSARRKYDNAAECYRNAIPQKEFAKEKLKAIIDDWCQINERAPILPNEKPDIELRFRNAKKAAFRCWKVDMPAVAKHVKANIENGNVGSYNLREPGRLIFNDDQGNQFKSEAEWRFLEGKPTCWETALTPKPHHFDSNATIQLPISGAGVYLLEARTGEHVSRRCIAIEGAKIVSKQIEGVYFWQVLDSISGKSLTNVNVAFLAWSNRWNPKAAKNILTRVDKNFTTDENGCIYLDKKELDEKVYWQDSIMEANCGDMGYALWTGYLPRENRHGIDTLKNTRHYAVTDRPVYHPGDTVHIKVWITNAEYGSNSKNAYASRKDLDFQLFSPKHEKKKQEKLSSDEYGAVETSWVIPEDATLGVYNFNCARGYGRFRVEEYRKPEYEVLIDAPSEPLMLGDKTTLKLRAKYYFGLPVTDASVSIRIERRQKNLEWWPCGYWDWLYGNGYCWLQEEYPWYPGWKHWGVCRPRPFWWHRWDRSAPELVSNVTGTIKQDGTYTIQLDTESAKLLYPDKDHIYTITAEVRDKSRRTIVGNATVIAATKPFNVYVNPHRGFYEPGKRMQISFHSRTPDGKPVQGSAVAKLLRVTYDKKGNPKEKKLRQDKITFGEEGTSSVDWVVDKAGQYRISCVLTDAKGRSQEGASLVTVRGKTATAGKDFRWNDLELVPEKTEYAPGETLRIAINTSMKDSTVMLFPRAKNGICGKPQILHLPTGSTVYETTITEEDMPNIIFEAYSVSNGQIHNVAREVFIPPVQRTLDVTVKPENANTKPGTTDKLQIQVNGKDSKPRPASLAVSVYDRSVDAIAGDCLPGDIRERFWKWRRRHSPAVGAYNLMSVHLLLLNEEQMPWLSMFEEIAYGLNAESNGDMAMGAGPSNDVLWKTSSVRRMEKLGMDAAPMMMANKAMGAPASEMAMDVAFAPQPMGAEEAGNSDIRSDFADTAFWQGNVPVGKDGKAQCEVKLPDNLTSWKICVWAISENSAVGSAISEIITSKDLMVRLETPRFLVEKDTVTISALVNSKLPGKTEVELLLELLGDEAQLLQDAKQTLSVMGGKDARCDWRVAATKPGNITFRVKAQCRNGQGEIESDGMESSIPILQHGTQKLISRPGVIASNASKWTTTFDIPEQIGEGKALLTVNWSPSLALAMAEVLPYLISFEYECTEQTLNRFLPALAVRTTLNKLGMSLSDIASHSANLNPQLLSSAEERKAYYAMRFDNKAVLEDAELDKLIQKNLRHLLNMQCSDGGWGWFSGIGEHSWPHNTLLVVEGLLKTKECGFPFEQQPLKRGIEWLKRFQKTQIENIKDKKHYKQMPDALDAYAFAVLCKAGAPSKEMAELLWQAKNELPLMGKIHFAEGLLIMKDSRLALLMENISQFAKHDDENQTSYLDFGNSFYWLWYNDENEAMARWLSLLVRQGQDKNTPTRLVKYLLNNRRYAGHWKSTRDTAVCVEAFAEYLLATREGKSNLEMQVLLDGKEIAATTITANNPFAGPLSIAIPMLPGKHTLEVRKDGNAPLYINAYADFFSMEDFIKAEGLEVKVKRNVYKVKQIEADAAGSNYHGGTRNKKVLKDEKTLLSDKDAVHSGDLLEVELVLESKNDYEYIILEDFRPAGTEPIQQQSGYLPGLDGAYAEFRASKVALFIRSLPRGNRILTYRVQAENPGKFSGLPAKASAMYAPELKGNSDECKFEVKDTP